MSREPREIKIGEREVIDGVLYVGTPCAGCGVVFLVYENAIYSAGDAFKFRCADCGPGV